MSVFITFEPQSESGLVAEGSRLLDAAKRLGVQIPAECNGKGECNSCIVIVRAGAYLLASPTEFEVVQLSEDRLKSGERLACQTKVERGGELVLHCPPANENADSVEEAARKFREDFRELPFKRKLVRLAEFEAVSAFEALTEIASLPFTVGEKVLKVVADFERKRRTGRRVQSSDEQNVEVGTDENQG